jgi:hypothetical protein
MSILVLAVAAAVAIPHPRVAIRFVSDSRLPPLAVAAAIREAADLWAPHGVAVEAAGTGSETVTITIADGMSAANERHGCPRAERQRTSTCAWHALAAATFVDGRPTGAIEVFVDEILRLVERGRLAGTAPWQWPRAMRERIVGRALGRVIAHEIGHIVLESRRHTGTGLMRATLAAADLIEPGRPSLQLAAPPTTRRDAPGFAGK